jgi:hypothetical protein
LRAAYKEENSPSDCFTGEEPAMPIRNIFKENEKFGASLNDLVGKKSAAFFQRRLFLLHEGTAIRWRKQELYSTAAASTDKIIER